MSERSEMRRASGDALYEALSAAIYSFLVDQIGSSSEDAERLLDGDGQHFPDGTYPGWVMAGLSAIWRCDGLAPVDDMDSSMTELDEPAHKTRSRRFPLGPMA